MLIDYGRDTLLTEFGISTLKDRYLLPGEESPQDGFARAARAYSDDEEMAQRMYDYVSKNWMMFSTPILSNGGSGRGLPISCFLSSVPDSREGITWHYTELAWMSSVGGGVGGGWSSVRSNGTSTRLGSESSGIIPFIKVVDVEVLAFAQGRTRRSSYAAYLDISHPEIEEFLELRKPTGGDVNRKALNLHHAVSIPDSFMQIIENCTLDPEADDSWPLIDPHSGRIVSVVSAKALWQKILELRVQTGEPYLMFIDAVNRSLFQGQKDKGMMVSTSNLCVAPETQVLTSTGYRPIASMEGEFVEVWNGGEFSRVEIVKTGEDQPLVTVNLDNGLSLDCTPYHKFYVVDGSRNTLAREVRAGDLQEGDRLIKFDLPVVSHEQQADFEDAYLHGFFCGDGTYYPNGRPVLHLYGDKKKLVPYLISDRDGFSGSGREQSSGRMSYTLPRDLAPKFQVPLNASLSSRLEWLAGYADADGTILRNGTSEALSFASANLSFLGGVQLLLTTVGCTSRLSVMHEARKSMMPDGCGGVSEYSCSAVYRLSLSSCDTQRLLKLGLPIRRLTAQVRTPQREAKQFVRVASVQDTGRKSATFCFREPKRGMAVFNGVLTGQCSEITLVTDSTRSAVCCLSSVNAEKFDEWKNESRFIPDLVRFLDNVLDAFIESAPEYLRNAVYSAMRERSIGIGVLGFHSYLQSKMIPFESALASSFNHRLFSHLKSEALSATQALATERGEAPDAEGYGVRNCHLLAVAPNASSSIICGEASPSIEPYRANAFTHKTMSGSFQVRNKYLKKALESVGMDTEEVWTSITVNRGSVQHLDLPEDIKDVFKTAIEIDQRWIIEHAAARQPYICQSQSVNLFFPPDVSVSVLHHIHLAAWKKNLKTLYYVRSEAIKRADVVSNRVERLTMAEAEECLACQ